MRKNKNENHSFKIGNLEEKRRIRVSIRIPNLRKYTPKYSDLGPPSRSTRRKRENESGETGEGDGDSLILFNSAITQSQFCP
jgi:hypothetical protein